MPRNINRVNGSPCKIWPGIIDPNGYPKLTINYKNMHVHRIMYRGAYGEIPKGLVIDHICRRRSCINPLHLRAITLRENILCGIGGAAINARKKVCKRGHKLSPENLMSYAKKNGVRACKKCASINAKIRRRKSIGLPTDHVFRGRWQSVPVIEQEKK